MTLSYALEKLGRHGAMLGDSSITAAVQTSLLLKRLCSHLAYLEAPKET